MGAEVNATTATTIQRILMAALSVVGLLVPFAVAHARTTTPTPANPTLGCPMADDIAVAALFERWNLALATLDSSRVAGLYWPDAVLLPTVSNIPRTDTASITDYFDHFLPKFPRGRIIRRVTHHVCGVSIDAGLYEFSMLDPAGKPSIVSARYTFAYTYRDGVWRIQHHHSSVLPEPVATAESAGPAPASETATHSAEVRQPSSQPTRQTDRAITAPTQERPRIQLESAKRMPWSFLNAEQRRKIGRETVGIKVCAASRDGERTFSVADASAHADANDAALAWAKDARWSVSGAPSSESQLCAQVTVRFADAGR